jgi:hypothetical protein
MLKIMLIAIAASLSSCVALNQKNELFNTAPITLFDGKSLDGWQGNMQNWSVNDGAITGENHSSTPLKHNTFLIYDKELPADYAIVFKYRFLSEKGNSGVQYDSAVLDKENFIVGGLQADFETGNTYSGILYEERGRGIMAQRGTIVTVDSKSTKTETGKLIVPEKVDKSTTQDGWQDYKIIFYKNRATHIINGYATVIVDLQSFNAKAHGKTLGLQLHAGPPMKIQFKDLVLQKLDFKNQEALTSYFTELATATKNISSLNELIGENK